ncbi:MAG: hypothetical protein E3J73_05005 [Candidatus Bathyarchaeum sp.]|nr:MAG: hypothetical protein E3J73_05005 [Candidatus Bathyarchaeum sp.]
MTALPKKNIYAEDISVLAAGENIIDSQAVVWSITITKDIAGDSVVSISDTSGNYDVAERVEKVRLTDESPSIQLTYEEGKLFSNGVSVISNAPSTDVAITYE